MSESLRATSPYRYILTPKETNSLYKARYWIFALSILGAVFALFDRFDGLGVIIGYGFAFLCPIIANAVWWRRLEKPVAPTSQSTQRKFRNPLTVKPHFFLPVLQSIGTAIEKFFEIPQEPPLICSEASSSDGPPSIFMKLQNHVALAIITTVCQVYVQVAWFSHLIGQITG